jgi:adenine-specific DNA-methyltransferase
MAAKHGRRKARITNVSSEIVDYRHAEKRKNNPEDGLVTYEKEKQEARTYAYDPHLDPELVWSGKAEHTSFLVDTVSLHIHERISTKAILDKVKKKGLWFQSNLNLFAEPHLPLDKRIEFYQHDVDWSNRMILGDSLLVMNSLIERELLGEKVQCIYIDPPYGIDYNSNFQPTVSNVNVQAGRDDSLTREPEQIRAYRDTWELGVHSYLTYLRDRLKLSRDLLSDSGSIFIQISDENVHHVRELLDEVFGPKNFVSLIPFRKKLMPLGAKTLENMCDYLLWYAKDKELMKYRQLYNESEPKATSRWTDVELSNGARRKLTRQEMDNLALLPRGSRVYRLQPQRAPSFSQSSVYEFEYKGRKFVPKPGMCWLTTREKMQELARANRLEVEGDSLSYVMYHDDFPYSKLTNPWMDTVGTFSKIYVVQTNETIIERCILMTTDPGELVFDPTCGGGTTAFVAEKWGRRWITCDTSRVAVALARARIMTGTYDYFQLAHPEEGVRSGFMYKTVPHITMRSIANDEPPRQEVLYDQPKTEAKKVRVSGPFTVEAIPVPAVEDPSVTSSRSEESGGRPSDPAGDHVADMIRLLQKSQVVNFPDGKKLDLEKIRPLGGRGILHAEADAINGERVRVAVSFGPRYGPIPVSQLEQAISQAQWDYKLLLLAGFSFDPEVQAFIEKNPHPRLTIHQVHITPDVLVSDLLKTPKGSQIFSVFGQPDMEVKNKGDGIVVELRGVDIYDPITGKTEQSRGDKVAAWFLDSDYDGYTFKVSQAFFPDGATAKNPWDKLENALKGVVDTEKMEQFRSASSIPFELGEHKKIAVKVIDQRGNEVIAMRDLSNNGRHNEQRR